MSSPTRLGLTVQMVGLAIENGGWEDEGQLQGQVLTRKGFAFNADKPGMMEQQADLFKSALKTVDITFQNLDYVEISITDVFHYYDSDPTKSKVFVTIRRSQCV